MEERDPGSQYASQICVTGLAHMVTSGQTTLFEGRFAPITCRIRVQIGVKMACFEGPFAIVIGAIWMCADPDVHTWIRPDYMPNRGVDQRVPHTQFAPITCRNRVF
jgi:hypothetical protein